MNAITGCLQPDIGHAVSLSCSNASNVVWSERGNVSYAGYEKEILRIYLAVNVLYCCSLWNILKIAYSYPNYVYKIDVEYLCY